MIVRFFSFYITCMHMGLKRIRAVGLGGPRAGVAPGNRRAAGSCQGSESLRASDRAGHQGERRHDAEISISSARGRGLSRRQFIAASAAGSAALALAGGRAFAQSGDTLKVGFISPRTGPLAGFGQTDGYVLDLARKALADGFESAARNSASRSSTRTRSPTRRAPASSPRT